MSRPPSTNSPKPWAALPDADFRPYSSRPAADACPGASETVNLPAKADEHRHGTASASPSAARMRSATIRRSILPGPFSGSASTKTMRRGWA